MENKLSLSTRCLLMRGGERIYINDDEARQIENILLRLENSRFVKISGQIINTADLTGLFSMDILEETLRTKRGEWQCRRCGKWLSRNERSCTLCDMNAKYPKFEGIS